MKHCIACGHSLPQRGLFELKDAPASAQDIPDQEEVKTDQGMTLRLYQCERCGLVQFDCEPVPYYRDVIRAGGFSTTMTELRRRQYRHMIEAYHLEGKKFLEVGCGRGEFIKVLTEFPVQVYGMEHKPELAALAQADGLEVWQEFPDEPDQIFADGQKGLFDVFLSFNFLEHQPRPDVMLQAIYHNLADDGMGLVTVPALEYILEKGSYYELIRDHIAYYSFGTLRELLEQNGFCVLEEEMINRDTISMIVKKIPAGRVSANQPSPDRISVEPLLHGYEITSRELRDMVDGLAAEGKSFAIWGASHQGFTLAATTLLGTAAEYIIDSAPFKQGRFAPASHLPIVPPEYFFEKPVDAILIVAPGYTDEIAGIIQNRFGSQIQVMTLRSAHVECL